VSNGVIVGLVFWIDKNAFSTAFVEKVFKKQNLEFYSLLNVSDFGYLIDDLKPAVIVLDEQTALDQIDLFNKQFSASETMQKTPFILIDERGQLKDLRKVGNIERPIDPFAMPKVVEEILSQL
jgi:hypothetical protein